MIIFEKSYIRVAKAPRFPQFAVKSGVPEQLQYFKMKAKILLICLLIVSTNVFAQSSLSLSEQKTNRERMRNIKKTYGYKDIQIWESTDGFYCYVFSRKIDGVEKYGIMDKDFNPLFPCEYNSCKMIYPYTSGYYTFPVIAFNGQQDNVQLYCYSSPTVLVLEKDDKTNIYNTNFELVSEFHDCIYLFGNWIFTGIIDRRQVYVEETGGYRKLHVVQIDKNSSVGMYKLDGTEIIKNDHTWFTINDHANGAVNYTNTYTTAGVGGFVLEDLSYKIPSTCVTVSFLRDKNIFKIKTSPTDIEHYYDPSENVVITTKNRGEELYREAKYEEALHYFSAEGVSDPDSKIYSAFCMLNVANNTISLMEQYLQDMAHRPKPKVYNFQELKELLETSRLLLESCKQQDTSRAELCDENIIWINKSFEKLESIQAQLEYNSFGNQLLRAIAEGVVQGIANGVAHALDTPSSAPSSTYSGSSSSSAASSSYSSSSSSDSDDTAGKATSNSRKRELQRQINTYQGYLRDAEAFEAKCRAEKSYLLGQAIRDVNKYKNKIQELQNELNGL